MTNQIITRRRGDRQRCCCLPRLRPPPHPCDITCPTGWLGRFIRPDRRIRTECEAAIRLLVRAEGIFLDPVYSGKALAGLLDMIRAGRFSPTETIVFWHTGGTRALFAGR